LLGASLDVPLFLRAVQRGVEAITERGRRSKVSRLLLGSTSEKVVDLEPEQPGACIRSAALALGGVEAGGRDR